ncbi:ADP-ribosylglycohydrolase family protein [Pelagibacterium halotolerans]|uniref:ADP-ribosylglycohydrolase family protein n=1 Tax=Pelagibacterium halotolerans TaxID=531813 RepID=UPI00384F9268
MTATAKSDPSFSGRVRGLLHGVAFGDAIGAPVEKLSPTEIEALYGRVTSLDNKWHRTSRDPAAGKGRVRGNGIVTDDTLMTLCLMAVYNEAGRHLDAWDMADGMVRQIAWVPRYVPELQRECPLLERLFYPEKWIFQRHQLASCDPRQGGIGNMVNCGAAMYIAPVGVVNACDPQGAYDEAIAFASGHQQSYGLEAAGVLAAAVAAAFVPGASVAQVVAAAHGVAKDGTRKAIEEIAGAAEKLRDKGADYPEIVGTFHARIAKFSPLGDDLDHTAAKAGKATPNYQPSRFLSIEELPLALGFCITAEGDFRKAVEDGVNSGRDTDSIGVMAGAILGAMHGDAVIDTAEADQLDRVNKFNLANEAQRFARTVEAIFDADRRRRAAIDGHRATIAGASVPAQ